MTEGKTICPPPPCGEGIKIRLSSATILLSTLRAKEINTMVKGV